PGLAAAGHVVADAVVATQDQRGHEAEELLRGHVQHPGLVGLGIEREEAPHDLVGLGQDALVHALAEPGELADAVAAPRTAHGREPWRSGSKPPERCSAIMSS